MLKLLLLLPLLSLFPFGGTAQELLFTNLSSEAQLPSQECYKIVQDKDGYIWFSSDNGLCRYGNSQLTVFDSRNGLPEESVYNIAEDADGKLWFLTSENRILYFDHGRLKEAPFNAAYRGKLMSEWDHPVPYFISMPDRETGYISNNRYTIKIDLRKNIIYPLPLNKDANFTFLKKRGHALIPLPSDWKQRDFKVKVINGRNSRFITLPNLSRNWIFHWQTFTEMAGTTDFIAIQDRLIKINSDLSHTVYTFPARILNLYVDKSNGLWVCTYNNGVYYYPDVSTMKLGHHSLAGYSVTGVCEDTEQGVWCSTLEKGIFYSRNKHLIAYNSIAGLNKKLSLLKYTDGRLFASSSGTAFFELGTDRIQRHPLPLDDAIFLSELVKNNSGWLMSGREIVFHMDDQFRYRERLLQYPERLPLGIYEIIPYKDHFVGAMIACILEIRNDKKIFVMSCQLPYVSRSVVHTKEDRFLLGGNHGVYEYDYATDHSRKINGIPNRVIKLFKAASGRVWVITKDDGIFWIDGDKVTNANFHLLIRPSVFFDLAEDAHGTIWAASNRGLYRFTPAGRHHHTDLYNNSNGLPSNEVYKVAADASHVWFSTFEGLFSLPLATEVKNTTGPAIHAHKLIVKGRKGTQFTHSMKLDYNQNDFRFTFNILTFKNGSNTRLQYRLSNGTETTTTNLKGNEVFLENLSPGFYVLKVYGINNDGVLSPEPVVFRIEITAPFWQSWWFITLAILLFGLLIVVIVRRIVRRIRKGEEAKTMVNKLMAEYQITALQAQMNPHFIFNAINTIQGYILEKNEDEAYAYLAKFSKLIRMVLHHSQEKQLLLENELEVLDLYISLEQLRFDNCFDYELQLEKNVDVTNLYIPGMLLQPYVENAIWHGIVNLRNTRRGKLVIHMERTAELLRITVTDNGIGRKMARSYNKDRRHKSVGMQITGQRLDLINRLYGSETASVIITDLFDNDQPAGTCVEVFIPINNQ